MTRNEAEVFRVVREEMVNCSDADAITLFNAGFDYAGRQLGLRPEVLKFALLMEEKLRKHDEDRGPRGWIFDSGAQLHDALRSEVTELYDAMLSYPRGTPDYADKVAKEAADVANFAMMIADVVGGLK